MVSLHEEGSVALNLSVSRPPRAGSCRRPTGLNLSPEQIALDQRLRPDRLPALAPGLAEFALLAYLGPEAAREAAAPVIAKQGGELARRVS